VSETPAQEPAPPEKGVADVLKEAYDLYRKHAGALIMVCAVLIVPASIVKSCAVAALTGPAVVEEAAYDEMERLKKDDLDDAQRRLQAAFQRNDKPAIAKAQADVERVRAELGRNAALAMGSFTNRILGFLGSMVGAFFLYGLIVPLAIGAVAIGVVDRLLGGQAGWREIWALLLRRLVPWMTAGLPAAIVVAFGHAFFYVPGVILGVLFGFLSPVVLFEGLRGQPAVQRSAQLVTSDWLRVALTFIALVVACFFAAWVAGLLLPRTALFSGSLLGDLLTMAILPLPAIGVVLLYLDVRRKREGYTHERLRADFEALKAA
jgi:hypothetical protein